MATAASARPAASAGAAASLPAFVYDASESTSTDAQWLAPLTRSWEELEEGAGGVGLQVGGGALAAQRERKARLVKDQAASSASGVVEKGVLRYVFIVLDLSWASAQTDLKPSRREVLYAALESFIVEFFDQNPLSQLGIISCSQGVCRKVTDLAGNPQAQIDALRECRDQGGDFSMQNAIDVAREKLSQIPPYGSREIILLMSALSTVDPGDLHSSISSCAQAHITCSVISLGAEMYVASLLASSTGGSCNVALNREHFQSLLMGHLPPLPATKSSAGKARQARKWIHMGFPEQKYETYPSLCACHEELRYGGYQCPKCSSKLCELPSECTVCGLTLVAAPHLARAYHHLQPVAEWVEVGVAQPAEESKEAAGDERKEGASASAAGTAASSSHSSAAASSDLAYCRACCRPLPATSALRLRCPACRCIFCVECDEYVHTVLHNCPGCMAGDGDAHTRDEQQNASTASGATPDVKMQS